MMSNQVLSKFPKAKDDRVSNPKPLNGRDTSSPTKKPTCKSVARSTMVIFLRGRIIVLVVVKVCTRFEIAQM